MKKRFSLFTDDKDLIITGPTQMKIAIDFDDVDHDEVLKEADKLVTVLNKYWR